MDPANESQNPYSSPVAVEDHNASLTRTFRIGHEEIHTVTIQTSFLRGVRTYSTNAKGTSTPVIRGVCEFEVGERELHKVAVRVDGTGRISLWVDNELVDQNLFPRRRVTILSMTIAAAVAFGILAFVLTALF